MFSCRSIKLLCRVKEDFYSDNIVGMHVYTYKEHDW